MWKHVFSGLTLVWALGSAEIAFAQPTSHPDAAAPYKGEVRISEGAFRRPHGQMEFALGLLTLPAAEVCASDGECSQGDASLQAGAWPLFRAAERFAVGAGLSMTLTNSSAPPGNDPPDIPREHSRRYFSVEGTARYYPIVGERFEGWVGVVSGLVVVRDGFAVNFDGPENVYVGPTAVTIATEGLSLSGVAGGAFSITPNVALGAQLQLGTWFLPEEPERSNLGDAASLSGQLALFNVGLTLTYRVRQ